MISTIEIKESIGLHLKKRGKSIKDILPEIEMTEAGYYAAIKNNSLKVSTLIKIAEALKFPVVNFLSTQPAAVVSEPSAEYSRNRSLDEAKELEILRSRVKDMERIIRMQDKELEDCQGKLGLKATGKKSGHIRPH